MSYPLLHPFQQYSISFSSFSALPNGGEADLRTTYCAFVVCSLLDDWSGMDVERAIAFIRRCSVRYIAAVSIRNEP